MEVLNRMIKRIVTRGHLLGFTKDRSNGNTLTIYYLLFINDRILFCGEDIEKLECEGILLLFLSSDRVKDEFD